MLGPNATYAPLQGDISPRTPKEACSEWESFSASMSPTPVALPEKPEAFIPNLRAGFLRQQRESEDKVISNLNRASNRLEEQRAVLPPKDWFLPKFVPATQPAKPLLLQPIRPSTLESTYKPFTHSLDSVDDLLDQFPSPRQDSRSSPNIGELSLSSPSYSSLTELTLPSPKRPVSQPILPAVKFPINDRRISGYSPKSLDKLPAFLSLLETSTERLEQQRAEHSRPRSWESPVAAPILEPKSNRRASLILAFDRIRRESSIIFSKKKLPKGISELSEDEIDTSHLFKQRPPSPSKKAFWASRKREF